MPETYPTTPPDARDIPGAPGYRIDPRQIVWSSNWAPHSSNGGWRKQKNFIMPGTGYVSVWLRFEGKYRPVRIHKLMLLAFIGPPPAPGMFGCHADDDKTNNSIENLRWGTHKENAEDAVRNGRYRSRIMPRPSRPHVVRVRPEMRAKAEAAILRLADGGTIHSVAREIGASRWFVRKVLRHGPDLIGDD